MLKVDAAAEEALDAGAEGAAEEALDAGTVAEGAALETAVDVG